MAKDCFSLRVRRNLQAAKTCLSTCLCVAFFFSFCVKAVVSGNGLCANALPHGAEVLRETDEVVARVEETLGTYGTRREIQSTGRPGILSPPP